MKIALLVSFVAALSSNIEGLDYGTIHFERLNVDARFINEYVKTLLRTIRDDGINFRRSLSKYNDNTLNRADSARKFLSIKDQWTPGEMLDRQYKQLDWEANFYKALSRALKQQYPDNKFIQENVHDGFAQPIILNKNEP